MNLQEFISKYQGIHVEVAGSANAKDQCVDLVNAYIREVLGKPIIEWTDAKDFPSKVNPNDYDWIPNPKLTVPQVGDIVVWSTNHIAICTYADVSIPWFTSFDQNWPTGSVCHTVDHNYTNVSGWLHPKFVDLMYRGYDLSNTESMKICVDDHIKIADGQLVSKGELDEEKAKNSILSGRIQELTTQISDLSSQLGTANSEKKALTDKVESQNIIIGEFQKEDAVQISDLRSAQESAQTYKQKLDETLWDIEDELKLSHPSDDFDTRWSKVIQSVQSLKESKVKQMDISDYSLLVVLRGKTIWKIS